MRTQLWAVVYLAALLHHPMAVRGGLGGRFAGPPPGGFEVFRIDPLPTPHPSSIVEALAARNIGGQMVYGRPELPQWIVRSIDQTTPVAQASRPAHGKCAMTAKELAEEALEGRIRFYMDVAQREVGGVLPADEARAAALAMYMADDMNPNIDYLTLDKSKEFLLGGVRQHRHSSSHQEILPTRSTAESATSSASEAIKMSPASPSGSDNCIQAELDAEGASPGAAGPPRLHGSPAGVDGTGPSGPCLMGGDSCKSAEHPVADPEAEPNRCVVCFSDISQEEAIPSEDCPCHWEQFCSRCMDTMRQSTLDKLTVLRCPLCRDVLPAVELQSGQLTGILHNLVLSRGDLDLDGARAVSRLLQGGADPNARVPGGYHNTAIHIAGINGHGELVRVLAEWGQTDLNVANYAQQVPLHYAAEGGSACAVRAILLSGRVSTATPRDCKRETPLHFAANHGFVDVCNALVEFGAELDARNSVRSTPLVLASSRGFTSCVDTLRRLGADMTGMNGQDNTGLQMASFHGHMETVEWFLKHSAHLSEAHLLNHCNVDGNTSLALAARKGHVEVVTLLLKAGADQHIANRFGELPLHAAAFLGQTAVIPVLMSADDVPSIDARTSLGRTPLHLAAAHGRVETMMLLLEVYSAQVTALDNKGNMPLHLAAGSGHRDAVALLIKKGADVTMTNRAGELPVHLAAAHGDMRTVVVLLDTMERVGGYSAGEQVGSARGGGPAMAARSLLGVSATSIARANANVMAAVVAHRTSAGQTPLHFAVARGHVDVARMLVRRGAEVLARNNDGQTAYDVAKAAGHQTMKDLLRVWATKTGH
eukprot:CAMPEP_0114264734 /NCGR_PEP_ID=MMETSP0058-20121206/23397_1 /TAXON_ID=36894 /ORGANISM="Pyramimonas parkeae, CCMP726" /LENGTH=821 /DNA_ID=CAMNT_0001381493 /DNA_START=368 /DNA_END=2833 /DNA_ORIENTATION=+